MIGALHWIVELPLRVLDYLPAWLSLAIVAIVSGAGMLWVVGKLTDQKRLEVARDHMSSAIYEMRLFMDSPVHILRAQLHFVGASFKYTLLAMPPLFVLAAPLALLYVHLEARYELAPLEPGRDIVVMMELAEPLEPGAIDVAPNDRVAVTAPPLVAGREAYLRVDISEPGAHELALSVGGSKITKRLVAGARGPMSPVRTKGLATLLYGVAEPPLPDGTSVEAIRVLHAREPLEILGMPWWLYWLGITMAAAMGLRKPMGVVL